MIEAKGLPVYACSETLIHPWGNAGLWLFVGLIRIACGLYDQWGVLLRICEFAGSRPKTARNLAKGNQKLLISSCSRIYCSIIKSEMFLVGRMTIGKPMSATLKLIRA